ncbi:MAG: extracellular solute-binding protein [Clostridia bacterium]|nr:extracellular solute-binding protein [Clostridia bacterium]
MKKITALFLSLMLLLPVAGCAADAPLTLTFWHCMTENAGVMLEEQVKVFNDTLGKENGIRVQAVYQGAYTDATTKMNNMLSSSQESLLPDVMQMDATGKVNYLSSGAAYTVDQAVLDGLDVSALLPAALGNWQLNGVQLGVPFATSTTVMYYNKTLLQQKGAQVPETFQDIAALAPVFAEDNISVYADLPNTPSLANWMGQLGSFLTDNENGNTGSATALSCVENGALLTFLTEWKSLYQSGALENAAGSLERFAAGQIVFICASSSKAAGLRDAIGDRFEMGIAQFPRVNEEAMKGSTASGSCLVMFDKGDDQLKKAARLFVSYMTGAPVQANVAVATGYIPANGDSISDAAYQALLQEFPDYGVSLLQLTETPGSMRSVTVGPAKDFYYAIQNNVSDMLTYDLTPEETVSLLETELNGLLYQYNLANP